MNYLCIIVTIKFGEKYSSLLFSIINYSLAEQRAYSYYIDVSMDQKDWDRVVDHTKYHCRSWQELFFKQRVVRYIRIVGTHNTANKVFHAVEED